MKAHFNSLCLTAALLLAFFGCPGNAQVDPVEFENQEQQLRYQNIIKELRCLVCQNQNLADSNAGLAKDLRRKTFEMVSQGRQYDEIIQYMVERYGEFVLYRPRITAATWLLWFAPFIFLAGIIVLAMIKIRKSKPASTASFTDAELAKARSLLESHRSR